MRNNNAHSCIFSCKKAKQNDNQCPPFISTECTRYSGCLKHIDKLLMSICLGHSCASHVLLSNNPCLALDVSLSLYMLVSLTASVSPSLSHSRCCPVCAFLYLFHTVSISLSLSLSLCSGMWSMLIINPSVHNSGVWTPAVGGVMWGASL